MYRRFLNDNDYLSVITPEALGQITRGNTERMMQAEESAEMSIVEYLSENYEVERELWIGKYIAAYDRRISFPAGAYLYYEGKVCEVIRSISGYKVPAPVTYWEESSDPNVFVEQTPLYSQFKNYRPGELVAYNGVCYRCLEENGYDFSNIRLPMVTGWIEIVPQMWVPREYTQWEVVEYNGSYYAVVSIEGFDANLTPDESTNWGEIADYDPEYNGYELSVFFYIYLKHYREYDLASLDNCQTVFIEYQRFLWQLASVYKRHGSWIRDKLPDLKLFDLKNTTEHIDVINDWERNMVYGII